MRRLIGVAFLLISSAAIAAGEDKPTSLRDAQAAVEANLATAEGKAYDQQLSKEFPEKYLGTMRQKLAH